MLDNNKKTASQIGQNDPTNRDEAPQMPEPLSFWETLQSVLWAMLGVQKKKNAQRDFSRGRASHFIVIGIIFAFAFVLVIVGVVSLVTPN